MNQQKRILEYMTTHGGITAAEAFRDLGVMRLSARIKEMREDGQQIVTQRVESVNRYGEKVHFARYKAVIE